MESGVLLQRVTLEARTETSDGHDGFTVDWAPVLPRRRSARVLPLSGRDLERARQIDPRISHEVTFRYWRAYRDDLDGGRVRLVYHPTSTAADDRHLELITPPMDIEERHVELKVLCRELA